ncbi:LysR family transcriptional regulator [Vibrio nigripulchritudo]|uniref:LysR family transcriptional regulator n=1 Tax=Vibrio nigripulchritudo TaxID=28173 RepID=UPI002492F62D|nr:LysR family transcriptional regulator [Vibrio nigripulchritudo]BDU39135.1 LysR family transcriptional regulator [Vibrio nigripulchritudo]BDU44855.1 LysR family transcriptional regulator [Vibrio nigripulchritudo]
MKSLPPLNYLRTFAIAAEYGSFKHAASILNVTPTAVSHQIKNLESHLGVELFERKIRSVALTHEGKKLATTTRNVFSQLEETLLDIQQPANRVSISCCTSFAALWLAPRLPTLNTKRPNLEVEICASDRLVDFNHERRVDIAVRYGLPGTIEDGEILLGTERLGCYAPAKSETLPNTLFVTEWEDESFIPNVPWQTHFSDQEIVIRKFNQEQYVLQAALAGQGVALVSDVLSEMARKQNWLTQRQDLPSFEGYSYYLRVSPHSRDKHLVKYCVDWFQEQFKERA